MRRLRTALALLLACSLLAPTTTLATDAPTSVKPPIIYHLQLALDIAPDGTPIGEGDVFPAGTPFLVAMQGWDRVPAGTELRLRIYQGERLVFEDARKVTHENQSGVVFGYRPAGGLGAGSYVARLDYNGVPDEVTSFTVTGASDDPNTVPVVPADLQTDVIPYAAPADVLVATCWSKLRLHLSDDDFEAIKVAAALVGTVHDLDEDGTQAGCDYETAKAALHQDLAGGKYRYLLILGNDDVIPYARVDNIFAKSEAAELESWELPAEWLPSDDPYVNLDDDELGIPELAVARIPSSDDGPLILTQLGEAVSPATGGFALVNQKRRSHVGPVLGLIDDAVTLETRFSPPTVSDSLAATGAGTARYTYILLHGIGVETNAWFADTVRWRPYEEDNLLLGEWQVTPGKQIESINVADAGVPGGVVDIGACYGGWTLDTKQDPVHKTRANSLALRYLAQGSRAFIADTHISYSSVIAPTGPYVARTGFEVLLWQHILAGEAPIDAFFAAKLGIAEVMIKAIAEEDAETALLNYKTLGEMIYLGRP